MRTRYIESPDNQVFKDLNKLKERKYRKKTGQFLIEGERFVEEAMRQKADISEIIIRKGTKIDSLSPSDDSMPDSGINLNPDVIELSEDLFRQLSDTVTPQGVMARVNKGKELSPDEIPGGTIVYLDTLQDPGNLGTIIRSCHAFGAAALLLSPGCTDPYSEKALRSSMGSVFRVPVIENVSYSELLSLRDRGYSIMVSALENAGDIHHTDFNEDSVIVIGNEGNGVSQELLSSDTEKFYIPMPGDAESLNAAVAASIILFEISARRQRRQDQ